MEVFDWSTLLNNIVPQDWLANAGASVKVALIDTGVHLGTKSLTHLDKPGRKFFVGRMGFNILDHSGRDSVNDGYSAGGHGTKLAGIIASQSSLNDQNLVQGIASSVDLFIFKARDNSGGVTMGKHLLDSIELAADLGVEIAVTAQSIANGRMAMEGISEAEIKRVMDKAKAANMLIIAALENRSAGGNWENIAGRKFPNNQENVVNVAAAPSDIAAVRNQIANQKIHFLLGGFKGMAYDTSNNRFLLPLNNSAAVAILAGVAALCWSALKSVGNANPDALLSALGQQSSPLSTANGNYPNPVIFKNF
jgi:subtilisin family serine protease